MRFDWKEHIKHLVQCLGQSGCSGTVSDAYSCPTDGHTTGSCGRGDTDKVKDWNPEAGEGAEGGGEGQVRN